MPRHVTRAAVPLALPHGPGAETKQSPTRQRFGWKTPARQLVLAAAAVVMAGCGTAESSRAAEPPALPPVSTDWWHTVPQTDEQKAEVAARSRQIDVCALVPRSELAALGRVRTVDNDQTDSCRVAFASNGAVDKLSWTSPPQGTSPDTRRTALHGADPCAVRARLDGTGDFGVPTITGCGFTYRGADVVISYKLLERAFLSKTEQNIDGRTVYARDTSLVAVVGPELPPGPTGFGGNVVPVVDVFADTEDVAKDVMRQLLPLFPAA